MSPDYPAAILLTIETPLLVFVQHHRVGRALVHLHDLLVVRDILLLLFRLVIENIRVARCGLIMVGFRVGLGLADVVSEPG